MALRELALGFLISTVAVAPDNRRTVPAQDIHPYISSELNLMSEKVIAEARISKSAPLRKEIDEKGRKLLLGLGYVFGCPGAWGLQTDNDQDFGVYNRTGDGKEKQGHQEDIYFFVEESLPTGVYEGVLTDQCRQPDRTMRTKMRYRIIVAD